MHNFVTLCHARHLTMIPKVMEHTVHNFNNELKIKLYIVEGICIHDGLYSYGIVLCRCYARNVCSQVRTGMYHTSNICVKKSVKLHVQHTHQIKTTSHDITYIYHYELSTIQNPNENIDKRMSITRWTWMWLACLIDGQVVSLVDVDVVTCGFEWSCI
jgi:hypothetical protein